MRMLRMFWDAAVTVDPTAEKLDESHMPLCRVRELEELWKEGGLEQVAERPLDITTQFESFADYSSTSCCVSQRTTKETASVFERWTAVYRRKFWPSSSKAMVRMVPFGAWVSSPLRNSSRRREFDAAGLSY